MPAATRPKVIRGVRGAAWAVGCVAFTFGIRWLLTPVLGDQVPFLVFFPAIVAASWFSGRGAGLLATVLSAVAGSWFLGLFGPSGGAAGRTVLSPAVFLLVGASISLAVAYMRRAQEGAQKAQNDLRRLAAIVEWSEDAIIAKDLEGRIVEWNRSAERLFGYPREEALGRSIEMLMPPDRADDWRLILNRVAGGERVEHFETRRRARDGRILDVSLTVSPVREADGRIVGAAKIVRDVTAERMARLEADKTRELFLGTLGHDLRNPLNTIAVSVYSLKRHASEADQSVLTRISNSAERMTRMIDQLLEVTQSRLGAGIPVKPDNADLAVVCRTIADEFEALHPGRIRLSIDGGSLAGVWDADRLAEVLSNLLSNAFNYGAPDTPVTVAARSSGPSVVVDVTNQGPEVPSSVLQSVFDPFRRGTAEQQREVRGLGLGLYIAREIVHAHGGEITARSGRDGTTFSVTLPRSAPPSPPEAAPAR